MYSGAGDSVRTNYNHNYAYRSAGNENMVYSESDGYLKTCFIIKLFYNLVTCFLSPFYLLGSFVKWSFTTFYGIGKFILWLVFKPLLCNSMPVYQNLSERPAQPASNGAMKRGSMQEQEFNIPPHHNKNGFFPFSNEDHSKLTVCPNCQHMHYSSKLCSCRGCNKKKPRVVECLKYHKHDAQLLMCPCVDCEFKRPISEVCEHCTSIENELSRKMMGYPTKQRKRH